MKLNAIWNAIEKFSVRLGRARARRELLALDDRTLADTGFSRELLEADAWPWRIPEETPVSLVMPTDRELEKAAAELRAYSDRELDDLGIARGEIDRAVRYGRAGVDGEHKRAA